MSVFYGTHCYFFVLQYVMFFHVHIPFLFQLEGDQGFKEFLSVHQNRSQVPTWANDTVQQTADSDSGQTKTQSKKKTSASDDYLNFDSDESEDENEEEYDEDEGW